MSAELFVYLRTPQGDGTAAEYEPVHGRRRVQDVPSVGDRMTVPHGDPSTMGEVVVVARRWNYPEYGSMAWPYTSAPSFIPDSLVDLVVELVDKLFADEAETEAAL